MALLHTLEMYTTGERVKYFTRPTDPRNRVVTDIMRAMLCRILVRVSVPSCK